MKNQIHTIHTCKSSDLQLLQHARWGACLSNGEDDCINALPDGFRCNLPDGTAWAVKGAQWVKLSVGLTDKLGGN